MNIDTASRQKLDQVCSDGSPRDSKDMLGAVSAMRPELVYARRALGLRKALSGETPHHVGPERRAVPDKPMGPVPTVTHHASHECCAACGVASGGVLLRCALSQRNQKVLCQLRLLAEVLSRRPNAICHSPPLPQALIAATQVMVSSCMVLAGTWAKMPNATCHSPPCPKAPIAAMGIKVFSCITLTGIWAKRQCHLPFTAVLIAAWQVTRCVAW